MRFTRRRVDAVGVVLSSTVRRCYTYREVAGLRCSDTNTKARNWAMRGATSDKYISPSQLCSQSFVNWRMRKLNSRSAFVIIRKLACPPLSATVIGGSLSDGAFVRSASLRALIIHSKDERSMYSRRNVPLVVRMGSPLMDQQGEHSLPMTMLNSARWWHGTGVGWRQRRSTWARVDLFFES